MRHLLYIAVSAVLIACTVLISMAPAHADRLDHLPALSPADYVKLHSQATQRPYHIYVRLPEDYDETKKDYPTVYLLDGDILFPLLGAYHLLLSYDEPVPEAIIVGISYGAFDRKGGNYRGTDYSTPPLPEDYRGGGVDDGGPDGGAAAYQKFLSDELIPYIEGRYRSDPQRRIIIGQSRGGHFVLYSALTRPDLFWGRIASNPALYPNREAFFGDLKFPASTKSNLFFSSGTRDIPRLREDALALFNHLENQPKKPWRLKTVTLEDETHAAGIANVYRAGMKWFFSDETVEEK